MTNLSSIDKNYCPSNFAENQVLDSVPGIMKAGRIFLKFSEVLVDHSKNSARNGGMIRSHIENLKYSFADGVNLREPLPIVEELPEPVLDKATGEWKQYQLIDGFNRFNALTDLGITGYWFDNVILGADGVSEEFSRKTLAGAANAHPPKLESNENDIWKLTSELVDEGLVKNDFNHIKDYIKTYFKLKGSTLTRVVEKVASAKNTPKTFKLYSQGMLKKGLKALGVFSHGVFDPRRKKHGWSALEGYEVDAVWNAIAKYYDSNKKSYIFAHVKLPDDNRDLETRRQDFEDTFLLRMEQLIHTCEFYKKTGKLPFEFIGFLPQDKFEPSDQIIAPSDVYKQKEI